MVCIEVKASLYPCSPAGRTVLTPVEVEDPYICAVLPGGPVVVSAEVKDLYTCAVHKLGMQ